MLTMLTSDCGPKASTHIYALFFSDTYFLQGIIKMSLNGSTSFIVTLQAEVQPDPETKRVAIVQILGDATKSANELLENVTLLQWAAQLGDIELANTLLEKGTDVNYTSEDGRTALHYAAQYGQLYMVKHLLKVLKNNDTPLHYAVLYGHVDMVKRLLIAMKNIFVDIAYVKATPLHYAVANNHLEIVRYLIDNAIVSATILDANKRNLLYYIDGDLLMMRYLVEEAHVDWSHADANGNNILHHCINQGYVALVHYLVDEQHADVEARGKNNWLPLHIASFKCCMPLIKHFIDKGCEVNAVTNKGCTPLMLAIGWQPINSMETASIELCGDVVRYLVEHGALLDTVDNNGNTALHYAASTSDPAISRVLINLGADVNMANHFGRTPLHAAATNGKDELLRLLIANGADANAKDKFDMSPLSKAVESGHIHIVKYLIETPEVNTAIKTINGHTLLHLAARVDNMEMMQFLIERASCEHFLNDQANNGLTCLHMAVYNGFTSTVRYLISVGANVNMANKNNRAPLHAAAFKGNQELLELLIANGADANAQDNFNMSPLSKAIEAGNFDIVKYLIEMQEVNTAIQTINGETLLHLAASADNVEMMQFLIENASCERFLNVQANNGLTCLHVAVLNNFTDTVRYLLSIGADVNCANKAGDTPLLYAIHNNNLNVVRLLCKHNANPDTRYGRARNTMEYANLLGSKQMKDFLRTVAP